MPAVSTQVLGPNRAAYRPIEITMDVPSSVLPQPLSEFGTADESGLTNGTINPWLYLRVTAVVTPPSPHPPFQLAGFFKADGTSGDPCDGFIAPGRSFAVRLSPENWQGSWTVSVHLESGVGSDGRPINVSDDPYPSPTATTIHTLQPGFVFNAVGPNPMAQGFRARGFLRVDHASPFPYYRFSNPALGDSERYFLKTGVDSPENFLAYEGFWETDKVPGVGLGLRHTFAKPFDGNSHTSDAPVGAPTWATRSWDRSGAMRQLLTYSDDVTCSLGAGAAGAALLGSICYLSDQGMNSLYMLPMNLGGDGRDVHPFAVIPENEPARNTPSSTQLALNYSVKRMQEWNTVFEFANRKGLMLQLVLHEQEEPNIEWLGHSPEITTNTEASLRSMTWARRLFIKQMVAHFGHNLGIKWNLCEENSLVEPDGEREFTVAELEAMANWIERWDSYGDHPITVHTDPRRSNATGVGLDLYSAILSSPGGDWLDATSFQVHAGEKGNQNTPTYDETPDTGYSFGPDIYGGTVELATDLFTNSGRNGVVDIDEQGSPNFGSSGRHDDPSNDPQWLSWGASPEGRRRLVLYQALFSGAGIEFYFGGSSGAQFPEFGGGDHVTEEYRSRGELWGFVRVARRLLKGPPHFWTMVANDSRVTGEFAGPMGNAQVFENADPAAGQGVNYHAIYYPQVRQNDNLANPVMLGSVNMDYTAGSGLSYGVFFFDPATGAQTGTMTTVTPNGVAINPTQLSGYVAPASNDLLMVITQS